jgi:hypothetical protein
MELVRFAALCITAVYVLDSLVYLTTLLQVHSGTREGRKLSTLQNKELSRMFGPKREVGEKCVVSRFIRTLRTINIMRLIKSSRAG